MFENIQLPTQAFSWNWPQDINKYMVFKIKTSIARTGTWQPLPSRTASINTVHVSLFHPLVICTAPLIIISVMNDRSPLLILPRLPHAQYTATPRISPGRGALLSRHRSQVVFDHNYIVVMQDILAVFIFAAAP